MIKELKEKVMYHQVILFVGAGVSASLGLPTWDQLMNHVAESLGIDNRIARLYGDNLALAEYYCLKKGSIGPLRSWMDKNWNISDDKVKKSDILKCICEMRFPLIYTTNYDDCIERAHSLFGYEFNKISKVEDLCKSRTHQTEIVKFHGDFEDDDSIVLTESSYFRRMDFETPLDIKLRADSLGKTILYIGYSLSDINIRYMVYKLNQIWKASNNQKLKPKSYIFLSSPNPVQEAILESRGITPIIGDDINPSTSLENFLEELNEGWVCI